MTLDFARRSFTVLLLAAFVTASAGCGPDSGGVQETSGPDEAEVVLIGVAVPLSSAETDLGSGVVRAAQLAVDDAAELSTEDRVLFSVVSADDADELETAFDVAQRFVAEDRLVAVIGHPDSDVALFVADTYERAGVPFLALATTPLLTERQQQYVNRMVPSEAAQGRSLARAAVGSLELTSAVVVGDGTFHGRVGTESFADAFVEEGRPVLERITMASASEAGEVARRIAEIGPGVAFVGADPTLAAAVARELGALASDTVLSIPEVCCTEEYLSSAGPAAEGSLSVRSIPDPSLRASGRDFVAYYESRYDDVPSSIAAYAYDAVLTVAASVLEVGADRERIASHLRSTEHAGVTGPIAFDEFGNCAEDHTTVYTVENGAWVALP
jgi:branched-chain amino acid transport system substrate-binding protein